MLKTKTVDPDQTREIHVPSLMYLVAFIFHIDAFHRFHKHSLLNQSREKSDFAACEQQRLIAL